MTDDTQEVPLAPGGDEPQTALTEPQPRPPSKQSKIIGKNRHPPARATNSPKNAHTSARKIALKRRMAEALQLRCQGYSFGQIAAHMGMSMSTVHGYVVEAMNAIPRENAQQLLSQTLLQIEEMLTSVYENAVTGDLPAQAAALNLLRERAKLMGIYPRDGQQQAIAINGRINLGLDLAAGEGCDATRADLSMLYDVGLAALRSLACSLSSQNPMPDCDGFQFPVKACKAKQDRSSSLLP
jgi:DNA-binding CsgD family transcriptional regulator